MSRESSGRVSKTYGSMMMALPRGKKVEVRSRLDEELWREFRVIAIKRWTTVNPLLEEVVRRFVEAYHESDSKSSHTPKLPGEDRSW